MRVVTVREVVSRACVLWSSRARSHAGKHHIVEVKTHALRALLDGAVRPDD